jgi:quercetin dioxygenase-like cupin family protein
MTYPSGEKISDPLVRMDGSSEDPVHTDGDKYRTILENERIRVLDYTDKPGDRTTRHHHPDFVLYALNAFKRRLTFGNGRSVERVFVKGDVIWMEDQVHIGENIGETDTHVLIIEIKSKGQKMDNNMAILSLENAWK